MWLDFSPWCCSWYSLLTFGVQICSPAHVRSERLKRLSTQTSSRHEHQTWLRLCSSRALMLSESSSIFTEDCEQGKRKRSLGHTAAGAASRPPVPGIFDNSKVEFLKIIKINKNRKGERWMNNYSAGLTGLLLWFSVRLVPEPIAPFYLFQNILLTTISGIKKKLIFSRLMDCLFILRSSNNLSFCPLECCNGRLFHRWSLGINHSNLPPTI